MKDTDKDEDERPEHRDDTEHPGADLEGPESEDSAVHHEDGDFDDGEIDEIDWFIDVEELAGKC